jgi:glycosyltransferase involved in cell wall biosynthesis
VDVLTGIPHYPHGRATPEHKRRRTTIDTVDSVQIRRLRHHVPDLTVARRRIRLEASFGAHALMSSWRDPDVVLCVSPALLSTAMCLAAARARRTRPAVGVWVQDLYSRGVVETSALTGRSAVAAARLESGVLRGADGVVAIHERFKSYMVDKLRVRAEKVSVIRNWTHLLPPPEIDRHAIRRRLGWLDDEVIVLHAGNIGAKQGLENVVAAAAHGEANCATIRFVLLGDGNQRARLEQLAGGIGTLQFIPPLADEEYRAAMAAADVLLVNEKPGVTDMALPSKITSYFTTGKPVIAATDANSVTAEEIMSSGGGVVVAPDDPAQLVETALALRADPTWAGRLGDAGRKFCSENLSADAALDQFEDWIQRLAAGRETPRPVRTGTSR